MGPAGAKVCPTRPHPAASALERGPAGFVSNTGSLGETLQYSTETAETCCLNKSLGGSV